MPQFLHFYFQFSKQTSQKHWYFTVFWQDNMQKTRCLKQFFTIFQLTRLHSKYDHFLLYFCRRSSGLKKALNRAKLLTAPKSTFCLSQSLPHSVTPKTGEAVWPQMLYITVFYEHTMHCTCKKSAPPPAKADCVSASGKTRFCTYGAGGFVARAVRKRSGWCGRAAPQGWLSVANGFIMKNGGPAFGKSPQVGW